MLALLLAVPLLAGCQLGSDKPPALNIQTSPPPQLASPEELDGAAIGRIAKAASENGGAAVDVVTLYQQLAARTPRSPEARVALGRALYARGDIEAADLAYKDALSLAPQDVAARIGMAQVLLARGQPDAALAAFSAIVAAEPENVRAINGEGLALDQLSRHGEAQGRYRRVLEIEPRNGPARNNLGLSLLLSGQRAEAIAVLKPLAAEPDASSRFKRSLALAQGGRRPGRAATPAADD